MKYRAKVEISIKPGLSDPEGETSAESLRDLGYKVEKVVVSKSYYVSIETESMEEAYRQADEMSKKLLANPVKDNYTIKVERIE